ncbi:hypothetical protein EDC01DRAFT_635446 [Geopyxis carbonaria]|nr:hypothetical protein EDC01DRAFT_635446 [Geopyxis carbonaria]
MPPKRRNTASAPHPAPKKRATLPRAPPKPARQKTPPHRHYAVAGFTSSSSSDSEAPAKPSTSKTAPEDDSDDDDVADWEDVPVPAPLDSTLAPDAAADSEDDDTPGDLNLTLSRSAHHALPPTRKKGASKAERQIRMLTHKMHVQFLLYAGWTRNRWACDEEVQALLLSRVPATTLEAIELWRKKIASKEEEREKLMRKIERKKAKGKAVEGDQEKLEEGSFQNEDSTLMKLLGHLMHWWRKRFVITAPALRKRGYKTLHAFAVEKEQLEDGTAPPGTRKYLFSTGNKDANGDETYTVFQDSGEWVKGVEGLRELAVKFEGSRDTGAVLFTALCRALGMEARLVYSLQPLGFGQGAVEEANVGSVKPSPLRKRIAKNPPRKKKQDVSSNEYSSSSEDEKGSSADEAEPKEKKSILKPPVEDKGLRFPTFWTEVYSPLACTYFAIDPHVLSMVGCLPSLYQQFEPRGASATSAKQVIAYVIAYAADGTAKDVTTRYLSKSTLPGKTKGFRVPPSEVPLHSLDGTVVGTHKIDWWAKALRGYLRPHDKLTSIDLQEDADLKKGTTEAAKKEKKFSETVSGYKTHPEFVLVRHLKREEAIRPGVAHVKMFTTGKGEKATEEKVFRRKDVVNCKSSETWYKEGRKIKMGAQSLKQVPRRAVTLTKKRELEDAKLDGQTVLQGLYSFEQTELYIPPPIEDGIVPKNSFGNIDLYVPTMLPDGGSHLPLKGAAKIAKKLGVDYAEAVIGFEFGAQRAVPVIHGIVVAEENEDMIRDAWREAERERRKKEEKKREGLALAMWRKFVMKARVLERLRAEYGEYEEGDGANPFVKKGGVERVLEAPGGTGGGGFAVDDDDDDEYGGGGFFVDKSENGGGGFLVDEEHGGGGFLPDDHRQADGFVVEIEEDQDQGGGFLLDDEQNSNHADGRTFSNGKASTVNARIAVSLADLLSSKNGNNHQTPGKNPAPSPREYLQIDGSEEHDGININSKAIGSVTDSEPNNNGEDADEDMMDTCHEVSPYFTSKRAKKKAEETTAAARVEQSYPQNKAEPVDRTKAEIPTTRTDVRKRGKKAEGTLTKVKKLSMRKALAQKLPGKEPKLAELAEIGSNTPSDVGTGPSGTQRRRSTRLAAAPSSSSSSRVRYTESDDINDQEDEEDEGDEGEEDDFMAPNQAASAILEYLQISSTQSSRISDPNMVASNWEKKVATICTSNFDINEAQEDLRDLVKLPIIIPKDRPSFTLCEIHSTTVSLSTAHLNANDPTLKKNAGMHFLWHLDPLFQHFKSLHDENDIETPLQLLSQATKKSQNTLRETLKGSKVMRRMAAALTRSAPEWAPHFVFAHGKYNCTDLSKVGGNIEWGNRMEAEMLKLQEEYITKCRAAHPAGPPAYWDTDDLVASLGVDEEIGELVVMSELASEEDDMSELDLQE